MEISTLELALSFAGGLGLGLIYFGGLWATSRWLPRATHPALLMVTSLSVRLALLLAGLYFIGEGNWLRLIAALGGIMTLKAVMVRRVRPRTGRRSSPLHQQKDPG